MSTLPLKTTGLFAAASRPRGAGLHLVSLLALWQRRTAERRHLAELTAAQLRDAGLRAEDVAVEAAKPFWRA